MRSNIVSNIKAVQEMKEMINALANRPMDHTQGLGMIYGFWALGKSYFPTKMAQKYGWIYYQLDDADTVKSLLCKLYDRIYFAVYDTINQTPLDGTTYYLLEKCLRMLQESPQTIILDEINYAINKRPILETIKSIVDKTHSEIIMIGMEDSKGRLEKVAPYIHSRVCYWVEAKPLDFEDAKKVAVDICEVELDDELIDYLNKLCNGYLRKFTQQLSTIEQIANNLNMTRVTYEDFITKEKTD